MIMRYFEDLIEGEPLECRPVTFTRAAIIEFGRQFDPQRFHVDENAARESIFGGLVASSLHTLSACTRVVVEAQVNVAILSGVGMHPVKMFNPVRPGDTLHVDAYWTDRQKSQSKSDRGYAAIKCTVFNQNQEKVIDYCYRDVIACRNFNMQPSY